MNSAIPLWRDDYVPCCHCLEAAPVTNTGLCATCAADRTIAAEYAEAFQAPYTPSEDKLADLAARAAAGLPVATAGDARELPRVLSDEEPGMPKRVERVTWRSKSLSTGDQRYIARFTLAGQRYYVGLFPSAREAAAASDHERARLVREQERANQRATLEPIYGLFWPYAEDVEAAIAATRARLAARAKMPRHRVPIWVWVTSLLEMQGLDEQPKLRLFREAAADTTARTGSTAD